MTSKILPILFASILCMSCSKTRNQQPSSNDVDSLTTKLKVIELDSMDTLIIPKELFEISADDFFQGEARNIISNAMQYESSAYVPLKIVVRDSKFFIPNLDKKEIWIYSIDGKKIGTRPFPSQLQGLDYFEILNEDNMLASNFFDGKIFEIDNRNVVVNETESQDVKFSVSDNNYSYRISNKFMDKMKIFGNGFDFDFPYSTYDSYLSYDKFFVVYFDSDSLKLIINNKDGSLVSDELGSINLKDYGKPYIIKFLDSQLFILLDPIFGRKSAPLKLLIFDVRSKELRSVYLQNPLIDSPLIGEGAVLWSAGMIFSYYNNKLYVMYCYKGGIKIFMYNV